MHWIIINMNLFTQNLKGFLKCSKHTVSQSFQTKWTCYTGPTLRVTSIFKRNAFMLGRSGLTKSALSPFPAGLIHMDLQYSAFPRAQHSRMVRHCFPCWWRPPLTYSQFTTCGAHHHCHRQDMKNLNPTAAALPTPRWMTHWLLKFMGNSQLVQWNFHSISDVGTLHTEETTLRC